MENIVVDEESSKLECNIEINEMSFDKDSTEQFGVNSKTDPNNSSNGKKNVVISVLVVAGVVAFIGLIFIFDLYLAYTKISQNSNNSFILDLNKQSTDKKGELQFAANVSFYFSPKLSNVYLKNVKCSSTLGKESFFELHLDSNQQYLNSGIIGIKLNATMKEINYLTLRQLSYRAINSSVVVFDCDFSGRISSSSFQSIGVDISGIKYNFAVPFTLPDSSTEIEEYIPGESFHGEYPQKETKSQSKSQLESNPSESTDILQSMGLPKVSADSIVQNIVFNIPPMASKVVSDMKFSEFKILVPNLSYALSLDPNVPANLQIKAVIPPIDVAVDDTVKLSIVLSCIDDFSGLCLVKEMSRYEMKRT